MTGAVYRVQPDGLWDELGTAKDDAPYDVAIEPDGAILVATGAKGKLFRLSGDPVTALLLTLVDVATPLWLPQGLDAGVLDFLRFHCACPVVPSASLARFAVVPAGSAAPTQASCHPGDPAYPDLSTTLLIEVASLDAGAEVSLAGPGIQGRQALRAAGLPEGFWRDWRINHQRFPLGVDVFLTHGRQLCALPRSTRVES